MTTQKPKIASLAPVVLPDQRRVMIELVVENLPTISANVTLSMPGETAVPADPVGPPVSSLPIYPNVELTIINGQGRAVASTFIVEHRQEVVQLTLHLRQPDVNDRYIARAELTYQEAKLDEVEIPFTLAEVA